LFAVILVSPGLAVFFKPFNLQSIWIKSQNFCANKIIFCLCSPKYFSNSPWFY